MEVFALQASYHRAMSDAEYWDIKIGEKINRTEFSGQYGGEPGRGVAPSIKCPNELYVFSNPYTNDFDIFSGFQEDGSFLYYLGNDKGETVTKENIEAVHEAVSSNRTVRFFRRQEKGEAYTYLGRVRIDDNPVVKNLRSTEKKYENRFVTRLFFQDDPKARNVILGWREPRIEPAETITKVSSTDTIERVVTYDEHELQIAFRNWMAETEQQSAQRLNLHIGAETLQPDLYFADRAWIVEAKRSAGRNHVRQAIGQVLDYCHAVMLDVENPISAQPVILLPTEPQPDLQALLKNLGIHLIVREADSSSFKIIAP